MALFKISKGVKANLPSTKTEGYCWFTTDDGKFYIDVSNSVRQVLNAGHADTAEKLSTARTISLTGDVSGSGSFDGSNNLSITTTVADNSHNHTITANASDDDIVVLTGTNGTNAVTYSASHAKKGPSATYTSGNTTTSISGSGASGTIKIPQITVDTYGHVTAAVDESITISIPTVPSTSTFLKKTGDTMTGYLAFTENVGYGTTLPSNPVEGQIFFLDEEDGEISSLPDGGTAGQYLIKQSSADGDAAWGNLPSLSYLPLAGGTITGTTASTSTSTGALVVKGGVGVGGNLYASKVYGAVWNDYAEYRSQKEIIEPGYCVASANNGQIYKTTEKFQACDGIVSDTFGFAIGETDDCKTPLAVAGRVLAYCDGNKNNYQSGDTVCAGPEGKVYKMTREEIREWPDRIIGIVSEIPEYETWGENGIAVNGRIWIKVK